MFKKFDDNLKKFIWLLGLNLLAIKMGSVFLNIFLMKISDDASLALVYNLGIVIMILIAFFIIAPICKRTSKKIGIFVGNTCSCILYLLVIIFGESAGDYVVLLGVLSGLSEGFFWLSMNTLMIDLTDYKNRREFNGVYGILSAVSQMFGPLGASIIISTFSGLTGYTVLFSLIFIIMVVSLIGCIFIKEPKSTGQFSMKAIFTELDIKRFKLIGGLVSKLYFREGVVSFLINIMIFEVTASESILGRLVTFMTILTIIVYFILGKIRIDMKKLYSIGTVVNVISLVILTMFFDNIYMIIIYLFLYGVSMPLTVNPVNIISQNFIQKSDKTGARVLELTCFREMFVGLGRISSTLFLLVLSKLTGNFALLWVFGLIAALLSLWSIKDVNRL